MGTRSALVREELLHNPNIPQVQLVEKLRSIGKPVSQTLVSLIHTDMVEKRLISEKKPTPDPNYVLIKEALLNQEGKPSDKVIEELACSGVKTSKRVLSSFRRRLRKKGISIDRPVVDHKPKPYPELSPEQEHLFESKVPYIKYKATYYARKFLLPPHLREDFVGSIALYVAYRRTGTFDESVGTSYYRYISNAIRGAALDVLRAELRKNIGKDFKEIEARALFALLGARHRGEDMTPIMKRYGLTEERADELFTAHSQLGSMVPYGSFSEGFIEKHRLEISSLRRT